MALTNTALDTLFREISPEAIQVIDTVNGLMRPNEAQLSHKIRTRLTRRKLKRLHMLAEEDFHRTVSAYLILRGQYPDVLFHRITTMRLCPSISDTTLFLVDQVACRGGFTETKDILPRVCRLFQDRYGDSYRLEQYLTAHSIRTTRDIVRAIDAWRVLRQIYPRGTFEREDLMQQWAYLL